MTKYTFTGQDAVDLHLNDSAAEVLPILQRNNVAPNDMQTVHDLLKDGMTYGDDGKLIVDTEYQRPNW